MHGRRIYHARGKVLGGSSSINGQIFQRGNPLDYERWAADPGDGQLGLRPLPALLQEDGELPRCRAGRSVAWSRRSPRPRARACDQPPVHGLLRGVPGGGLPADGRRQRLPPGRFRALRPEHPRRPPPERRPGLPEARPRPPEPDGPDADAGHRHRLRWAPGHRGRHRAPGRRDRAPRGGRDHPGRRRDQHPTAPAAVGCRACRRPGRARHPGRGRPARRRRPPPGPSRGVHPVHLAPARLDAAIGDPALAPAVHRRRVAVPAPRPRRDEPFRRRRLRAQQRRRRVSESHVPFPATGHPVRRAAPARPDTATRSMSVPCTPTPAGP